MIQKRLLIISLFFVMVFSALSAQSRLNRANKYMKSLNYAGAIELYNQVLEKEDNSEAKMNIAEAYRKVNDTENAEYWYGQVVRLPEAEPLHKLYYGQMLQRNGKCDLAREWYQQYVEAVSDDVRGQFLLRACDYEEELMTKSVNVFEVAHLDFNSHLDDFSPAFYQGGLIFASDRDEGSVIKREHTWTGNPFLELFFIEVENVESEENLCSYIYGQPEKFSKKLNTKYHDAVVTFSNDQEEIFFTRNNFKDGKTGKDDEGVIRLKVFSAKNLGDGKWGDLESLPFNSDEYSVSHPTLSGDGNRLFFASDMPGGFGGMDLYLSDKESGRWGPPMNLGPIVNTEGNEIFPYFDNSGRLYFSSDGQVGLGGLDIYSAEDRGNGEWSEPENMGFPVNTIADDFGIVFNEDGTCGFFSSDRIGGAGRDDIYSFVKKATPVQIYVYDADTQEPIEGAMVVDSCTSNTLTTGSNGKVVIDMELNKCCTFSAGMEGYEDNAKEGCTKNIELGELIIVEIPLTKALNFEITGIVFDQSTGLPIDGAIVSLSNTCDGVIPDPAVTDLSGRYSFKLEKECCYTVRAEKENYFANSTDEDICTVGKEESEIMTANIYLQPTTYTGIDESDKPITPPGVQYDPNTGLYIDENTGLPADGKHDGFTFKGGELVEEPGFEGGPIKPGEGDPVAYLLHVYYDFDKSFIRDEAIPELEKLFDLLVENSDFIVEIGSHADSRGSKRYNLRLSQRRAESVVNWLVDRGIERERLVPRGYGEKMKVNECADYVPCSEREHQLNRRTEFRVLGCLDCVDESSAKISKPNENVKVDPCVGCPF
ncbi:MAG: OmpA family protein [Bacteroidetes bacterium]|nr:OmpA family protein [Bacteroidota bacterium]